MEQNKFFLKKSTFCLHIVTQWFITKLWHLLVSQNDKKQDFAWFLFRLMKFSLPLVSQWFITKVWFLFCFAKWFLKKCSLVCFLPWKATSFTFCFARIQQNSDFFLFREMIQNGSLHVLCFVDTEKFWQKGCPVCLVLYFVK